MTRVLLGLAAVSFGFTVFCLWGGVFVHHEASCLAALPTVAILTGVFLTGGLITAQMNQRFTEQEDELRRMRQTQND